jgi:transposase
LERRWQEGCRNATRLWREVRAQGFGGGERTVRRWAERRRQQGEPIEATPRALVAAAWPPPSSRRCARLLTTPLDQLDESERLFLQHLNDTAPDLVRAGDLAVAFAALVRRERESNNGTALDDWIAAAKESDLGTFARGLERDAAAVRAAVSEPWSTSPVEGQINRLKMLKRTMYGRAKHDLLRQRVLAAA